MEQAKTPLVTIPTEADPNGVDPKTSEHQTTTDKADGAHKLGASDDGKQKDGVLTRLKGLAGGWLFEYISVFISAVALTGMSILLWHFDQKPAPTWSYTPPESLTGKSARVSLNSILELFSRAASISLAFPLTKALGQLAWVWFKKHKRQLTDLTVFDDAAKHSLFGSLKLVMMMKGRLVHS